ncbi:LamG-like jellyroll fold domain-containing protein [uncultured Arcticibacterium sp.]|uniref:LamG-like jellyroll fold domain-containing protein n=1 Tax=uncultured Arcticibacterium sp. TaxID=2173042 RepID=UPI0030F51682
MKRFFYLLLFLTCFIHSTANAQWSFNTRGNQYNVNGVTANTEGTITLTSTGGGVKSTVTPEGIVSSAFVLNGYNNTYHVSELNSAVASALNEVPVDKWFKAKTGKNETIQLNYSYRKTTPANNSANPTQTNTFTANYKVVVGSNESHSPYQNFTTVPTQVTETQSGNTVTGTLQATVNFPVGSTKGYVVIPVLEEISNFSLFCNRNLPPTCYWIEGGASNVIILPFIVEGASIDLTVPDAVGIAGYTKEPAIPYMILHAPPGDNSSVTFEQAEETCRSYSESVQDDFSASGKLDVTLGIAGSAGLFVTTDFEFSVTASVTGGGGNTQIKKSDTKTCINAVSSISTLTKASGVSDGTIYMGYSSDLAYGFFPRVIIESDNPLVITKDTALIFGVVGQPAPFYMSKQQIINDIAVKQSIVDGYVPTTPINEQALSLANHALNQIKVWEQVLSKDSANVASQQNDVIRETYTIGGDQTTTESISYSSSTVYDVNHYISAGAGVSFVVKVAGSGVSGGAQFSTKKTFGQAVANTTNSTTSIKWRLYDDDITGLEPPLTGERIRVKIVRDPDYGTPIFLLDSAGSRTSAPYEGGYQRDQPYLKFSAVNDTSYYTVPNVAVGTTSQFGIKLCNESDEERPYLLRFDPSTNANNVTVSLTGSNETTEYGSFTVPANSCLSNTYFVNVNQQNLGALTSQEINLQLYVANEPSIKSDIFVTSNWGDYALPSALTSSNSVICPGTDVTLSAFCPAGTTTWYDAQTNGTMLGTGNSITQTPTANTDYFVVCQAGIYNYPRVKASSVLVPNTVFPSLNLTSNIASNSLQLATTAILASNKIFSPSKVSYLAGNSLTFEPGFEVSSGGIFEAKIGGCANLTIDGLVAYYPFNGNANDESGNGHNGIIDGATLTADKYGEFGSSGKALNFDGDDVMRIPNLYNAATQPLNNVTYSLWFKPNQNYGAADFYSLIIRSTDAGFTDMIGKPDFGSAENNKFQFYMFTGDYVLNKATTIDFIANVWYHVVAARDDNTTKIYLNAVKEGEVTYTNPSIFYPDLYLGGHKTFNRWYFNGALDDLRIYNRALSDAEIQAIYNAEKP